MKNNYESIPSLIIHLQKNDPDININKEALKSIYSIDDETSKLRYDTDNIIKNEKDNVNNVSIDLTKQYEKKTKDDSSKIFDDILKQADLKNKEIEKFYDKRKSESGKIFESTKDSIVKEFFEKIIS